eukprot:g11652.t1
MFVSVISLDSNLFLTKMFYSARQVGNGETIYIRACFTVSIQTFGLFIVFILWTCETLVELIGVVCSNRYPLLK